MNHKNLARKAAERMKKTTRPKQTANTFFKHLRAYLKESK
jgi:hypothetical protein